MREFTISWGSRKIQRNHSEQSYTSIKVLFSFESFTQQRKTIKEDSEFDRLHRNSYQLFPLHFTPTLILSYLAIAKTPLRHPVQEKNKTLAIKWRRTCHDFST